MIKRYLVTKIGMPSGLLKARDGMGQKIIKPVLQELVMFWHREMLPRHFKAGASRRYNFAQRKAGTWARKRRAVAAGKPDAMLPLVLRGDTRDMVSRAIRVSGTAKSATGRMAAPRVVTHAVRAGRPNLAAEITTVSPDEQRTLARMAADMIAARMNQNTDRQVEVI